MSAAEELQAVADALAALEADAGAKLIAEAAVERMRMDGLPITYDSVIAFFGRREDQPAVPIFAALVVREHFRQRVAAALEAAPIGTAH